MSGSTSSTAAFTKSTKRDQRYSRRNTKIINSVIPEKTQRKEKDMLLIVTVPLASTAAMTILALFLALSYRKRKRRARLDIGMLYFMPEMHRYKISLLRNDGSRTHSPFGKNISQRSAGTCDYFFSGAPVGKVRCSGVGWVR